MEEVQTGKPTQHAKVKIIVAVICSTPEPASDILSYMILTNDMKNWC